MHTFSSMTLILVIAGIVIGVVATITIQKSYAEVSNIEGQQKMGQQNDCRNNSTCANIGSSSFKLLNIGGNDTKHITMGRASEQVNSVKDDPRVDTTPFLLPFP